MALGDVVPNVCRLVTIDVIYGGTCCLLVSVHYCSAAQLNVAPSGWPAGVDGPLQLRHLPLAV